MHIMPFENVTHDDARASLDADLRHAVPSVRKAGYDHSSDPRIHLSALAERWLAESRDPNANLLADTFPHVANQLALIWREPFTALDYLDSLITDTRCGRQGFPEPALRALLKLHDRCTAALPPRNPFLPNDPWIRGSDSGERRH